MPAYKYQTKDGKTNGMLISITLIGLEKKSINAKEDSQPSVKLRNMNVNF